MVRRKQHFNRFINFTTRGKTYRSCIYLESLGFAVLALQTDPARQIQLTALYRFVFPTEKARLDARNHIDFRTSLERHRKNTHEHHCKNKSAQVWTEIAGRCNRSRHTTRQRKVYEWLENPTGRDIPKTNNIV